MILTILDSGSTCANAISYNEDKILQGVEVFFCRNLPGESEYTIRKVFGEYENNPLISARVKNIVFHMAVSPDENDPHSDATLTDFLNEVLERIGYGEQPLVVYRHNDIEREHFHVVAPTVKRNGRVIRNNFAGSNWNYYGLMHVMREVGEKYGYKVHYEQKEVVGLRISDYLKKFGKFSAESSCRQHDLKHIFNEAMRHNYTSVDEFRNVLFSYRVEWSVKSFAKQKLEFRGVDSRGYPTSQWTSIDRMFSKDFSGYERFVDRLGENSRKERRLEGLIDRLPQTPEEMERYYQFIHVMAIVRHAFSRSRNAEEFRTLCYEYYVDVRITREDGLHDLQHTPGEKLPPAKSIAITFNTQHFTCSEELAARFISPAVINEAERTGRWDSTAQKVIHRKLSTPLDNEAIAKKATYDIERYGITLGMAQTKEEKREYVYSKGV